MRTLAQMVKTSPDKLVARVEQLLAEQKELSKELENDAQNMDALLDGAYTLPGLTDGNLLALIEGVTKHS